MNIGLDYDDTYTRDPIAWDEFLKVMRSRGHYVYITTWRNDLEVEELKHEGLHNKVDGIYATNRKAKEKFMYNEGIRIDVWIDDMPWAVCNSMVGYE